MRLYSEIIMVLNHLIVPHCSLNYSAFKNLKFEYKICEKNGIFRNFSKFLADFLKMWTLLVPIIRPLPIVSDQIRADKVVITPSVITVYANV